jgi:Uri superfamily endonuclease
LAAVDLPDRLRGAIAGAAGTGLWVAPDDIARMPGTGGAYALTLYLAAPVPLSLPRIASLPLSPGWYVYLGSARGGGGIRARVARHFRTPKKPHWHIDRLTQRASLMAALCVEGGHECGLVSKLLELPGFSVPVSGFGSTDCKECPSHLLAADYP